VESSAYKGIGGLAAWSGQIAGTRRRQVPQAPELSENGVVRDFAWDTMPAAHQTGEIKMSITGGFVTFEQSRKLADYENRKAAVSFTVSEPEGEDAEKQVGHALDLARHLVLVQLGIEPPRHAVSVSEEEAEPEKKTRKPRTKRPEVVIVEVTEEDKARHATPAKDPLEVDDDVKPAISTGEERVDPEADPLDVEEDWPAPTEVTDKDLLDKIGRKNAALLKNDTGAPVKIRKLIGTYVQAPKKASDIPQEVRQKFLDELDAITA